MLTGGLQSIQTGLKHSLQHLATIYLTYAISHKRIQKNHHSDPLPPHKLWLRTVGFDPNFFAVKTLVCDSCRQKKKTNSYKPGHPTTDGFR